MSLFKGLNAAVRNGYIALVRALKGVDANLAVFSSFGLRAYNDSPRYVSEALHALRPQTRIVWLFHDPQAARKKYAIPSYVDCRRATAPAGLGAMARARVLVDNYRKWTSLKFDFDRQKYVHITHGDRVFKRVGFDSAHKPSEELLEAKCDRIVCGCDMAEKLIHSAFHYNGAYLKVGLPRNDLLARDDPADEARLRAALGFDADTRLVLYAPTFRDDARRRGDRQRAGLSLKRVLDTLERATGEKWKCLVRAHYLSLGISLDDDPERLVDMSDYPEMAELLRISDALITDYSSCAGDYAVRLKPIWLYQDDLSDYEANSRALYFQMKDLPYWTADTPEALDHLIEATTPEAARENCRAILDFYGVCDSGHAAQDTARYLAGLLG